MSIAVSKLHFAYGSVPVLRDVSFCLEKGDLLAVLGPNGAGKSTLFRCVLGLLPQFTGEIKINEKKIGGYAVNKVMMKYNEIMLMDAVTK